MKIRRQNILEMLSRAGLLLGSIVISLLLLEGLVRTFMPQQLIIIRPDIWVPDNRYGWSRAPNLDTLINTGERTVHLLTDEAGNRISQTLSDETPELRILALGDSFTEGLQVEQDESMTGQIQEQLTQEMGIPIEVVNTGVAGWGPSHYLLKAEEEFEQSQYDLVLVFLYMGNDVEQQRITAFEPKQPATRHSFRIPHNLTVREIIDSFLYPLNDYLEVHSHLFVLIRNSFPDVKSILVALRHADKRQSIDPAIVYQDAVIHRSQASSTRWTITADTCAEIARLASEHGAPTIFVLLPAREWIVDGAFEQTVQQFGLEPTDFDLTQPARLLEEEFDERDLITINMMEAFEKAAANGTPDLYGAVDTHFGPSGHRLVAEVTAAKISTLVMR